MAEADDLKLIAEIRYPYFDWEVKLGR